MLHNYFIILVVLLCNTFYNLCGVIAMSIIYDVIKEELDRNLRMQQAYEKELGMQRQGSLVIRRLPHSNNVYFYLGYRANGKVVQQYLGIKNKLDVASIKKELNDSRKLKLSLRELKNNEARIRKALNTL